MLLIRSTRPLISGPTRLLRPDASERIRAPEPEQHSEASPGPEMIDALENEK